MSTKTNDTTVENNVGEILSRSEKFIDTYKKQIVWGITGIILLVILILAIRHFYFIPKEKEAQSAIYPGEMYFANEEWDKALFGDSVSYIGFESIIDEYSFTKTAKLAKAYAGISYYHKGDNEKALSYLKKINANDKLISPALAGMAGDCYVEMGKTKEGIDYFLKASSNADNNLLSGLYLKKAGLAYESMQDYKKAADVYKTIKEKYPLSQEASDIDKYIIRAEYLASSK